MSEITFDVNNISCNSSLFTILDFFPIPIEVFSLDGNSIFVNKKFLEFFCIESQKDIVGKFNVLEDTYINDNMGLSDHLRRVFAGEFHSLSDVRVPFEEIGKRFCKSNIKPPDKEIYQDIIVFPLISEDGSVRNIISMFVTKNIYQSRLISIKIKDYIDCHWMEDFNMRELAKKSGLCSHYLSKIFKKHFGMTPYSYYQEVRVNKIKEALENFDLSISEAFTSCGMDYSGGIANTFKRKTGMTPSMYRKALTNKAKDNSNHSETNKPYNEFSRSNKNDFEGRMLHIVKNIPIPIQVFRANGDIIYINNALLKMWNIMDTSQILGKYNLISDPFVHGYPQLSSEIKRAFRGDVVLIQDIRIPLESFWEWNKTRKEAYDVRAVYADILNIPIMNASGHMLYMLSLFFTSRIYQGNSMVARAREYIENNWRNEFDIDKLSEVACLSPSHLVRLFKKYTGVTPYKYYMNIKVVKLKASLRDKRLSIAEAFLSCGFEYSGNYARFFKMQVGMSPSQYRKSIDS